MIYPETAYATGVIDDAIPLSQVMLNALSWLLSILGIVAIVALVLAGVWYMVSSGNTQRIEQAKRMMVFIVIGLAVGLSALVIVWLLGSMVQ
jgi:hypothetical protein